MKTNYEINVELKPIYLKNENTPTYLQIVKNLETGKFTIFNKSKNQYSEKEYTEIDAIEVDSENLFLLLNDNGCCGIYDYTSNVWAYNPQYQSVRFISSENSIQRAEGTTYMCVLEMYGSSGLFTFTKMNGNIIDRQSLIPIDNYSGIQTNLFTEKINPIISYNGLKEVSQNIHNMLFIELEKDGKKGCVVIENQINNSKSTGSSGGEFNTVMEVPCVYENLRPSEFNGDDGLSEDYIDGDDVYLYDKMSHCIGSKNGVYYPISRQIILNDSEVIKTLKLGLLLYGVSNKYYGVLHNGNPIIPAKFSPQIQKEETEELGEHVCKFWVAGADNFIYEYKSHLPAWKENLEVSKFDMNGFIDDTKKQISEFFNNIFKKNLGDEDQK